MLRRLIGLAVLVATALGFTGAGGVWVQNKGNFTSTNKDGTFAGLQQAGDFMVSGGLAQVSAGRYSITGTLVLAKAGSTFNGSGDSTVFESSAGGGGDTMIVVTGDNVTLRNISFDGRRHAQTSNVPGVMVTGKNCTIEKCTFRNFMSAPIKVSAPGFKSIGNTILEVGAVSGAPEPNGIYLVNADSATIMDTRFAGTYGPSVRVTSGSDFAQISGSRFGGVRGGGYFRTGIYADSTCKKLLCQGNHFATGDWGLDCDADSSLITDNIFLGRAWHSDGSSYITFTGNKVYGRENGGGAVFFEMWEDQPGIGLAITYNDFYDCGQALQVESNLGTITGLGPNRGIVFEGNRVWGARDAVGAVRFSSVTGGWAEYCRIANNYIYKPLGPGIRFHWSGSSNPTKRFRAIDVIGNTIIEPGTFGVQTSEMASGDSVSTMFLSGNTVRLPGSGRDYDLSQTNWVYSGTAGGLIRTSVLAVDDIASVADTLTLAGVLARANNQWTLTKDSGGTLRPIARVDSVNTLVLQPITGANVDVYHTDGTVATRLYGTGGISVTHGGVYQLGGTTTLSNGGNDTRLHSRNAAGSVVVRNAANSADLLTVQDGGSARILHKLTVADSVVVDSAGLAGYVRAGGNIESSGGHLVAKTTIDLRNTASNSANPVIFRQGSTDAIEFRPPGSSSPGYYFKGFGGGTSGPLWAAGTVASMDSLVAGGAFLASRKAVVTDSLMVHGPVEIGRSASAPAAVTIDGGNGATAADSATIILNGSTLGSSISPAIRFLRGGITKGMFSAATSSFGVKTDSTTAIGMAFGWLGSAAAQWSSAWNGAGRKLAINKTGPSAYLDVAGNGIFTDSLRVNRGLQVGETATSALIVGAYSATATLDFASGTVGDLTISVAGAAVGDPVVVGVPNGSVSTTAHFTGWVSSAGTVTVRCSRDASEDPASGTFRVTVLHY